MNKRFFILPSWLVLGATAALNTMVPARAESSVDSRASTMVQGFPPGVDLAKLATVYSAFRDRSERATAALQRLAAAEPHLLKIPWTGMLAQTAESLVPIGMAEALADPRLRPIVLDSFREPGAIPTIRERFAWGPEGGGLNFPSAQSPAELAVLIAKVAPAYQRRLAHDAKVLNLPPALLQNVTDSVSSGWMQWFMKEYFGRRGYVFDAARTEFISSPKPIAAGPVGQNYPYLKTAWGDESVKRLMAEETVDPKERTAEEEAKPNSSPTRLGSLPAAMAPAQMSALYRQLDLRATAATQQLSDLLDSAPERFRFVREKLMDAMDFLRFIAVAQAMKDPLLSVMMKEKFGRASEFQAALGFLRMAGVSDAELDQITTADQVCAALALHEGDFGKRYEEELRSLGIPRNISDLLGDSGGAGWLRLNVTAYMKAHGYSYNAAQKEFVIGDDGDPTEDPTGTIFSIALEKK